jgi:hypothetical protein
LILSFDRDRCGDETLRVKALTFLGKWVWRSVGAHETERPSFGIPSK